VIMKEGRAIEAGDLGLSGTLKLPTSAPPPGTGSLNEMEGRHIAAALKRHGWNITHTAGSLGISRKTLRDRMARHGIKKPERLA
jgi:DNA-binding NtrC family response regulator